MSYFTDGQVVDLEITHLILDDEIQARARGVTQTVVDEYAAAMRSGVVFPPIDVFVESATVVHRFFVADGFHRARAAYAAKIGFLSCRIHNGDKRAAILFAVGANRGHGLRRTSADKRRAAEILLRDPEWSQRSGKWIADQCGIDYKSISRYRAQLGMARPDSVITRTGPKKIGRMGSNSKRHPNIEKLFDLAHQQRSLSDICDEMGMSPRMLHALTEKAREMGKHIDLPTDFTHRLEHRLRAEVRDLNAAKKHLLNELESREKQIETLSALKEAPPVSVVAKRGIGEGKRRQCVPVMMISDLHVEEPVPPEKVNGLNEYNLDIAKRCIARCGEAFEWITQDKRWDMRTGVLAILGDTYSGYIHAELEETSFLSPIKAVMWVQEELERLIRYILAHTELEKLIVPCKDGNHGRTTQKIRAATRTDNSLEWLMYKTLAARFDNEPRVQFIVEEGLYTYIDVYDETLGLTHGDQFQYQGGVGGLLIPVRRGLNEVRKYKPGTKRPIVYCMGHFHEEKDEDDVVINGSAIGMTPWSLSKGFKPENRAQHWFLVDSSRGKKAPRSSVWLPLK